MITIDKQQVLQDLIEQLEQEIRSIAEATQATIEGATHEDAKAENQYDTRGLEQSYLARGQAERLGQIRQGFDLLEKMQLKTFTEDSKISVSALLLLDEEGEQEYFFIAPSAGGMKIKSQGRLFRIITPQAPLGRKLMGLQVGDFAEIKVRGQEKSYEIISIV